MANLNWRDCRNDPPEDELVVLVRFYYDYQCEPFFMYEFARYTVRMQGKVSMWLNKVWKPSDFIPEQWLDLSELER